MTNEPIGIHPIALCPLLEENVANNLLFFQADFDLYQRTLEEAYLHLECAMDSAENLLDSMASEPVTDQLKVDSVKKLYLSLNAHHDILTQMHEQLIE